METNFQLYMGGLAGVVALAAFIPYLRSILRGRTRPSRISWAIWALVSTTTAAAYWLSGARGPLPVAVAFAAICTVVAILSIRYGEWGGDWLDWCCLWAALSTLLTWLLLRDPTVVLYLAIFIDSCALIPTIRKAYARPASEDLVAWSISLFGMVLNLFAIEAWAPRIAAYPLYCVIAVGTVVAVLLLRGRLLARCAA